MDPPTDAQLREVLSLDRVAVVGCSTTPGKAAHDIPQYLLEHGFDVVPVNPYADEVLGRPAADSLSDVEGEIDVVDVFRPSEEVAGIVDEAIDRGGVRVIWTQLGIRDDEAAGRARQEGMVVVQDRCMKVEHQALLSD